MEVFDKVKVFFDNKPYFGIILNIKNAIYRVSVFGKKDTYEFTENEMTKLN